MLNASIQTNVIQTNTGWGYDARRPPTKPRIRPNWGKRLIKKAIDKAEGAAQQVGKQAQKLEQGIVQIVDTGHVGLYFATSIATSVLILGIGAGVEKWIS